MKAFTSNIKKSLRGGYKQKARPSKHAKHEELHEEIAYALRQDSIVSHVTGCSDEKPAESQLNEELGADNKTEQKEDVTPPTVQGDEGSTRKSPFPEIPVSLVQNTDADDAQKVESTTVAGGRFMDSEDDTTWGIDLPEYLPEKVDQVQSIRDESYMTFVGENADDYTEGPIRFVLAADGIKHCPAVLMNLDFSTTIQEAIRHQSEHARLEVETSERRDALQQLEWKVNTEIDSYEARILAENKDENKVLLEQYVFNLERFSNELKGRQETLLAGLETKATILREVQTTSIAYLEEALIHGLLIQPALEEPEFQARELDFETELTAYLKLMQGDCDDDIDIAIPPVDTYENFWKAPPLWAEEQAKQDIIEEAWTARQELREAQYDFEDREATRKREFQMNKDLSERGEETIDKDPETFDIRWVQKIQELMRRLINAETAFAAIKLKAKEAGIDLGFDDQESTFGDLFDDGYRISAEQEMIATIPSPTVKNWLTDIPEDAVADLVEEREADHWDSEEVDISDSVSLVAEGKESTRIDQWRKLCEPKS